MPANNCNMKKYALPVALTVGACGLGYIAYKKYVAAHEKKEEKPVQEPVKPNIIFLLGGPGSGKGTQSKILETKYKWIPISAGDCLREEQQTQSKDADLIREYIREGKIVPGHITINLLWKKIQSNVNNGHPNMIIDGFPRSMENLNDWNEIVGDKANLLFILLLECSDEVMTERVMSRSRASGREDDNPEALIKRFKTHHETSLPVIELFRAKNMVRQINADQTIEQVSGDIQKIFDEEVHC
ncbi:hypothetical protein WA158_001794 [Blastocystis sp. Blastoise]